MQAFASFRRWAGHEGYGPSEHESLIKSEPRDGSANGTSRPDGTPDCSDGSAQRLSNGIHATQRELVGLRPAKVIFRCTNTSCNDELTEAEEQVQLEQAAHLISEFCGTYPAVRVHPTEFELKCLWERCVALQPSAVSDALLEQFTCSDGIFEWQPCLRALCVVEHFLSAGGQGPQEVAASVLAELDDFLRHLAAEVPQCRSQAQRLLRRGSSPSQSQRGRQAATLCGARLPAKGPMQEACATDLLTTAAVPAFAGGNASRAQPGGTGAAFVPPLLPASILLAPRTCSRSMGISPLSPARGKATSPADSISTGVPEEEDAAAAGEHEEPEPVSTFGYHWLAKGAMASAIPQPKEPFPFVGQHMLHLKRLQEEGL